MPQAADLQKNRPDKPSCPQVVRHGQKNQNSRPRYDFVSTGNNRENNMSAIQLTTGQQVERRSQHTYPGGDGRRMKQGAAQWQASRSLQNPNRSQQTMHYMEN